MEQNKDLKVIIQEAVAKAIANQMKIHSEAVEKKLDEKLEIFTTRLEKINEKIEKIEKDQVVVHNKLNNIDGYINNLWKENKEMKRENEELLKKVKEGNRKVEVTQDKLDDLEQYGRKTMLEINGFPRMENEDPWKIVLALAEKLEVALTEDNIEACHRISGNEKAGLIVEFASRKKRDEMIYYRKKLANISIKDFGYEGDNRIYVNESLTPKRKSLIRELKAKKDEYNFKYVWSKKGIIFIRRDENSRALRINSLIDLNKLHE